jgi:hypothetical protein
VHSKVIRFATPFRHLINNIIYQYSNDCYLLRCPLQLRIAEKFVKSEVYFLILNDELPKVSALLGTMPY